MVTVLGAVTAGVGYLASAFAPSIYVMYVTYGGLTGLGLGLMYQTSLVVIPYWLDSKRALATGIAASGSGFGVLTLSYLAPFINNNFG